MNKVLVTGLALGRETGASDVCSFDYRWIVEQPSTFVWADKIILTPFTREIILGGHWTRSQKLGRSTQLLFQIAEANGLIEMRDPREVIDESISMDIYNQIRDDVLGIVDHFPERTRLVRLGDSDRSPLELFIDEKGGYCTPYLWSAYAGLLLARAWNATCLFDQSILNYYRCKFGLARHLVDPTIRSLDTFSTVFTPLLPNEQVLPEYAIERVDRCDSCQKDKECESGYLVELEKRADQLLRWRAYDEVHEVKSVIERIIRKKDAEAGGADPIEILREFKEEEARLRTKVSSVFPKVTRWANLATMLSVPLAITGLSTQAHLLTLTGAGIAGAATVLKEGVAYMKSQYQWVSFLGSEGRKSG